MTAAVRAAAAGDAMLSPRITRRLLDSFARPETPRQANARRLLGRLTERERAVLGALARGLANADIARELHLSEATVKTHVSRILTKLQLTNRVQAPILVHQAGE